VSAAALFAAVYYTQFGTTHYDALAAYARRRGVTMTPQAADAGADIAAAEPEIVAVVATAARSPVAYVSGQVQRVDPTWNALSPAEVYERVNAAVRANEILLIKANAYLADEVWTPEGKAAAEKDRSAATAANIYLRNFIALKPSLALAPPPPPPASEAALYVKSTYISGPLQQAVGVYKEDGVANGATKYLQMTTANPFQLYRSHHGRWSFTRNQFGVSTQKGVIISDINSPPSPAGLNFFLHNTGKWMPAPHFHVTFGEVFLPRH